jgi:hypothetical protein
VYRKPTHTNLYLDAISYHHVFKQNQRTADPQSPQPPSPLSSTGQRAPLSRLPALYRNYIQQYKQCTGPTQHQICGLDPHEIIQSPPSGQGPPGTKDTRGLQDPL